MSTLIAAHLSAASPWQAVSSPSHALAGGRIAIVLGEPWLAGGTTWTDGAKDTLATVQGYNPGSAKSPWGVRARLPAGFSYGVSGEWRGGMVVAGGADDATTHAAVWQVKPNGTVSQLASLPAPCAMTGGAVKGDYLYILGGTPDARAVGSAVDAFLRLDLRDGSTTKLAPFPEGPVIHAVVVPMSPDRLVVFPGGGLDPVTRKINNQSAVWSFDLQTNAWTRLALYPFPVRGLSAVAVNEHTIYAAGGFRTADSGNAFTAEAFWFDLNSGTFTPAPALPYAAGQIAMWLHDGQVHIAGGEDRPQHRVDGSFSASLAALRAQPASGRSP